MDTVHYILDNWDYLLTLTLQHLWLVALAVGLAILIGVPLGVLIVRHKWLATFTGHRYHRADHSVHRPVWSDDPALFADRSGYRRPARDYGGVSLLAAADCT